MRPARFNDPMVRRFNDSTIQRFNALTLYALTLLTLLTTAARAANLLTGTIIGTSGSFNNAGNTKEKAFDGNTATFFDAPTANNDWLGLDMTGQLPKMITSVRFFPRASFAGRMLNGMFQASNTNDFSTNVILGTITSTPTAGVYTTMTFSVTNAFSYVRYLSPTNGSGNVSELEFYGIDLAKSNAPAMSTNLTATAGDSQVSLTWAS